MDRQEAFTEVVDIPVEVQFQHEDDHEWLCSCGHWLGRGATKQAALWDVRRLIAAAQQQEGE